MPSSEPDRWEDDDPITPDRILHLSEQIWSGDVLEQDYNYLVYEFDIDGRIFRARAYLDEIETVSCLGAFSPDAPESEAMAAIGGPIDPRVLAYFRRRYRTIRRLTAAGYETVAP